MLGARKCGHGIRPLGEALRKQERPFDTFDKPRTYGTLISLGQASSSVVADSGSGRKVSQPKTRRGGSGACLDAGGR